MEYEVTIVDGQGHAHALLIDAGEAATVGTLKDALAGGPWTAGGTLFAGEEPLSDDRLLADSPCLAGTWLSLGRPYRRPYPAGPGGPAGHVPPPGPTVREVAIVGGLAAGTGLPLPGGPLPGGPLPGGPLPGGPLPGGPLAGDGRAAVRTLGRASGCDLVIDDPEVSRRHAEVRVEDTGAVVLADLGSRNGTASRGYRIAGDTRLEDGDTAQVGESMVSVRPCVSVDVGLELDAAYGLRRFNRPPRIGAERRRPEVVVPAEPDKPRGFRFPLATVLLPLLLAAVVYALLPGSGYFLIFLALSPLMVVGHVITERRSGRKEYRDKLRGYHAEMAAIRARLGQLALAEERATREQMPDLAALVRIATGPTGRLFERRPADDDFARLRIGLSDRAADVRLTGPGAEREVVPMVYAVPVAVEVARAGVLGVAGPRRSILPIARALLAQAATLHAPHDLGIVVLTGFDEATDWEWASWLPHTVPHRADLACRRMVATDREQAEARLGELSRILDERRAERRAGLREHVPSGRRLLVVLDGARRLRSLPGVVDLLAEGPSLGVYALCLDVTEANLPAECRATAVAASASGTRIRVSQRDGDTEADVLADGLPLPLAERLAHALAPIRVLGARFGEDGDLPDRVRYLDLAGLGTDPSADNVLARWAAHPGGRSTKAIIGADANGPVTVDLRRDGPHALVAGTSGAGKSELLQTLVASLALGNAPDALNLVLVDYKGGSAFAECAELPHCVGMVTDLDGHLASRALASLSAELRRREAILADAGAKDIEDYWARTGGRLPRLVIVVDEFATLVEEVPEFVTGVVGIGMRGRSLGVHVVLATQRPGGVVNAEMRANLNLRLCLRVTRGEESSDVVDVPDAARISRLHPGRAYLRTGHQDLTIVQCARVGWPRVDAVPDRALVNEVSVARRRIIDLGRPVPSSEDRPGLGPDVGHGGATDLTVLVAAVRAAAERTGVSAGPSPWLPPLPERVTVAELEAVQAESSVTDPAGSPGSPVAVALGLADHPASQAQMPFVIDLELAGPVVIAGMVRSGRSTALRTLAAALAARTSPADVHLYILDYGRALAPLSALPHCGACVHVDEPDRAERLLDLLTAEVARRTRLLSAGGYASLGEQRRAAPSANRLPYLLLLVDRFEAFLARHAETDGGRLVDALDALLRRGAAAGITAVLATDRSGFTHRLGSVAASRLVLRQADPDDMTVFGAVRCQTSMPAGRAVFVPAGVEVQVGLLTPDPEGAAQAAAVEELAGVLTRRWDGIGREALPRRIDPLPLSITMTELAALRVEPRHPTPTVCMVGAGGDHLAPIDVDLADAGSTFLVAGPPRSGRSAALGAVVASLSGRLGGEMSVLICCPRPSPLIRLAELPGVIEVLRGSDVEARLEDAIADVSGPVALVIDDAELLADGLAASALETVVRTVRDDGNLVIAAGTTEDLILQRYRGWLATVRRSRCGLLLNPSSYVDGEVFDVRLPKSTSGGWPPGRGLLVERGSATVVQVPLPSPELPSPEAALPSRPA